jgi:SAM-dependent methyltransferase
MGADIRTIYNDTAKEYSVEHERRSYWLENSKNPTEDYLKTNAVDLVMDIGCGSGTLMKHLASNNAETNFVGIDFSERLIDLAQRDCPTNAEFIAADFTTLGSKIVERLDINDKKVLLVVAGPMEYYKPGDDFTLAIEQTWNRITRGRLMVTFHNAELLGRSIIRRKDKKYWSGADAVVVFGRPPNKIEIKYFSFFLLDMIAAKFAFMDDLLIRFDCLLSGIPFFSKHMCANFRILVDMPEKRPIKGHSPV